MAKEIVVSLRLSEGNTREAFRALNRALVETRKELTENNKLLRDNAKAQRDTDKALKEGIITQQQAEVSLLGLREERNRLLETNANLRIAEGSLAAQYRESKNEVAGLTEANLRFRDKMADANLQALRQSGILEQLGARTNFLTTQVDRLTQEFREGTITEERYRQETQRVESELTELGQKTQQVQVQLDKLNQEFVEGRISQEEFRARTSAINTSIQGQTVAFTEGIASLKTYALSFFGVIEAAQFAIRVIKDIGQTVAEFDQQLANVRSLGVDFATEIDKIGDAAIELGPKLGIAPVEALKAFEELAKAGLTTEQILTGGLEAALTLSAAGIIGVGNAAETTASTLTQFNLSGAEAARVADALVNGANEAQGGVDQLRQALNQSALVAAQFGLSLEETVGALTTFASAGLLGSDAGTSFRTMLLRLGNPTKESAGELERLGIAAFDAQGNFVGIENLAGQLQDRLKGLTEEQRNASLAIIFGQDAVRAANVLYRKGSEEVARFTAAVAEQGTAAAVAQERNNSLAGDLNKLKSSYDALILSVEKGDGAIARFGRSFIQSVTNVVERLSGADTQVESLVDRIGQLVGIFGGEDFRKAFGKFDRAFDGAIEKATAARKAAEAAGLATADTFTASLNKLGKTVRATAAEQKFLRDNLLEVNTAIEGAGKSVNDLSLLLLQYNRDFRAAEKGTVERAVAFARLEAVQRRLAVVQQEQGEAQKKSDADSVASLEDTTDQRLQSEEEIAASLGNLRAKLKEAKKERDALNISDKEGLAQANAQVAAIEKQIAALEGKTKRTKEESQALREQKQLVKDLDKAERDRLAKDFTPQQREEQQAQVTRDERIIQAKNDTALLKRIEEDFQASLEEIRQRYAIKQVADQDKLNAELERRRQQILQADLARLDERQELELVAAAQRGEDLIALTQRQQAERLVLVDQIQQAEVEAFLQKANEEYFIAEQQGLDLQALTLRQEEELAALKAGFRAMEAEAARTALQGQLQLETELKDLRIAGVAGLGQAISSLAKNNETLAKAGFVIQKAAAAAEVILNLQREIAAYFATYALVPGGQIIATGLAAAAKARAAISLGVIAAQTIGGFDKGGYTAPGHRLQPAGVVHAGEWVAPQWQVKDKRYAPMIEFLERERTRRGTGMDMPFASGGIVPSEVVASPSASQIINIENLAEQRAMEFAPVVLVSEINRVQNRVAVTEALSTT
jgi:TP901 family phage tail tape measure protein